MSKATVKIGVRIVERPGAAAPRAGEPYKPPKAPVYKAIATCDISGRNYSRTASRSTESQARLEAFSRLATLVARQGAVPVKGFGFEAEP